MTLRSSISVLVRSSIYIAVTVGTSHSLARAQSFHTYSGTDPSGDDVWEAMIGAYAEFDFEKIAGGGSPRLATQFDVGDNTMTVHPGFGSNPAGVRTFRSSGFGTPDVMFGNTLVSQDPTPANYSRVTFKFAQPVAGFGCWVFDDGPMQNAYRLEVTLAGGGAPLSSACIDNAGAGGTGLEGFLGVYGALLDEVAVIRLDPGCADESNSEPFEIDHVHVAGTGIAATHICQPVQPNSSGTVATIRAEGRPEVMLNDFRLSIDGIHPQSLGYALVSDAAGYSLPASAQSHLCLGGLDVGRFRAPGQIIQGPSAVLSVNLNALPLNPVQGVVPGDCWVFQWWYRDVGGVSNFSDALSVQFE